MSEVLVRIGSRQLKPFPKKEPELLANQIARVLVAYHEDACKCSRTGMLTYEKRMAEFSVSAHYAELGPEILRALNELFNPLRDVVGWPVSVVAN